MDFAHFGNSRTFTVHRGDAVKPTAACGGILEALTIANALSADDSGEQYVIRLDGRIVATSGPTPDPGFR